MKKANKPTIEVVIPALNEEQNIKRLVTTLIAQIQRSFSLTQIHVMSDASTDGTNKLVQDMANNNSVVKLTTETQRIGKYNLMGKAFKNVKSDFLVVFDADIKIDDPQFLEKLVQKFINDPNALMVAAHNVLIRPTGFVPKLVHSAFYVWDCIRFSVPNYDSGTNFYGTATGFRKSFARSIQIPKNVTDPHLYIFLSAQKEKGFRYCRDAQVLQWPITTFADYIKLCTRTIGKKDIQIECIFGVNTDTVYYIPLKTKLKGFVMALKWDPIFACMGLMLSLAMKVVPLFKNDKDQQWNMLMSTKKPFAAAPNTKTKKNVNISKNVIFSIYDSLKNEHYAGGGAVAVHAIAKRMAQKHNVTVIAGKYYDSANQVIDGVTYQFIGTNLLGPQIGHIVFWLALHFYALKNKHDVWIETTIPPVSFSLLPLFTKKPVVSWVHMLSAGEMKRKYKLPITYIEKLLSKNYKHFVVLSEWSANRLKNTNANITIIGNGVDSENNVIPTDKGYLLYIGRIEIGQKGLDLLLKSMAQTKSTTKLVIAGAGDMATLNKLIKKYNLANKVQCVGTVNGDQKSQLLAGCTALVLPSRFDTYPMVVLEALSYYKPLITFDLPQLSWLPQEVATKVTCFDTQKYAAALTELLENKKLRNKMASNARAFIQDKTWENVHKKFVQLIEGL